MAAVPGCFRRRVLPLKVAAALLTALCAVTVAAAGTPARAATPAVSGTLYAWGINAVGELGDGGTTQRNSPEPVTLAAGVTATAVSAGGVFSLAIGSDGNLYAWGDNSAGELGDGTTTQHDSPVLVTLAAGVKPTVISAGDIDSLAIGSDGNLYAWGDNSAGELGDGTTTQQNAPEVITLAAGVKATAVSAEGSGGGLAIGSDGNLYAWGSNSNGQLGDGTTTDHDTPEVITLAAGVKPTAISAGVLDSMAIGSDGKLYGWGYNANADLGDGTTTQQDAPEVITLATGVTATAVSAGTDSGLAIGSDGKLYAWGSNPFGQLGDGTTTGHKSPEVITLAAGVKPVSVSAAGLDGMAIGSDGNLYAWGSNSATLNGQQGTFGELGDGTTTNHFSPEVITLGAGVVPVAVSAGLLDTLAIGAACSDAASPAAATTAPACPGTPSPTSSPSPTTSGTHKSSASPSSAPSATARHSAAPSTPATSASAPAGVSAAVQAAAELPLSAPATGGGTGTDLSGPVAAAGAAVMAVGAGFVVFARRRRRRPPV